MSDTATDLDLDLDLPHRQEAFARHVASGRSLTAAARLSGYAWDGARQAGSRLMRDARVAARVAELIAAEESRRREETDELVGMLKRVMLDALEKRNHFAVLRAVDRIARFRGLMPNSRKPIVAFDDDDVPAAPPEPEPAPEPAPPHEEMNYDHEDSQSAVATARRMLRCMAYLEDHHPEIACRLSRASQALPYFDRKGRLLPRRQWPALPAAAG
ncbi:terminase small subunit [Skermanella pratensis]|uniref:terminase small subunit n=1 Tax=Skermanella pratensis TaxID=2233999 RepID=UPI0013011D0D|nr:terminase small subunit [Skermanella pratensis]